MKKNFLSLFLCVFCSFASYNHHHHHHDNPPCNHESLQDALEANEHHSH